MLIEGPKWCGKTTTVEQQVQGIIRLQDPDMRDKYLSTAAIKSSFLRDLKAYSQSLGGIISYYHDRYDLEADAVLHLEDGRYALIEFKLGSREIEEGAAHLKEIKRLVQEHNKVEKQIQLREPDLMLVITAGDMAYTRPD